MTPPPASSRLLPQSVKAEKTYVDVQRCQQLQKQLLLCAIDSCNANGPDGGFVVYSTCSVTVEENEAVVNYALASRCVKVVDTGLPFGTKGFTRFRAKRFHASLEKVRPSPPGRSMPLASPSGTHPACPAPGAQ